MLSFRHIGAGCALAVFACSASAGTPEQSMGRHSGSFGVRSALHAGASKTIVYVENFDAVPFGEIPAAGLDLEEITVRYGGGSTSGVQNGRVPDVCPQLVADGAALGPVPKDAPYDIVIDLKVAPTFVQLGLCGSPFSPSEDTTIEFFAANGTKLQSTTYPAGRIFEETLAYEGSTPVGYVTVHGGGHVYVDNIIMEVAEKQ